MKLASFILLSLFIVGIIADCHSCKCNPGYQMINGRCVKCLDDQVYDLTWGCRKTCPENYVFNGRDCVCAFGYDLIDGKCGQCPADAYYRADLKACHPRCKNQYEFWQVNRCACVSGYYRIQGVCKKCTDDEVYEPTLQSCRKKCQDGLLWIANECQCVPGSYWIDNRCQICPAWAYYDKSTKKCQNYCKKQNQRYTGGKCECIASFQRDQSGVCRPRLCPDNSYYSSGSETCVCNPGCVFNKNTGQCETKPKCPNYSEEIKGVCVCKDGWYMNTQKTACFTCEGNEEYDGIKCTCKAGYFLDSNGKCSKIVIPTCLNNEYYHSEKKACFCKEGFEKINGVCTKIPQCKQFQYWNGQSCSCMTGYTRNSDQVCEKIVIIIPVPECSYNSKFNGVKCVCNEGFFEYEPGLCATCPPLMFWNGKKCSYNKQCWEGYKWDDQTECCVAIGPDCPQNSELVDTTCQCNQGYNLVDNSCIKCKKGFRFDGSKCSRIEKQLQCIAVNRIAVNNQCVCRPGTNQYQGLCIQCPFPTVWNGLYCQGTMDGCFSLPNSEVDPTNRKCKCKSGFRPVQGSCLPIYGRFEGDDGQVYLWKDGYRWDGFGLIEGKTQAQRNEESYREKYQGWQDELNNGQQWHNNHNQGQVHDHVHQHVYEHSHPHSHNHK